MDRFWPFQEPGLWPELVRTPCDMDSSICRRSGGQTTCDKREGHCHTLILHRFMPSNGNLSLAPVPESACSINVLFRRIHMTGIGRRAMPLRMECLASTSCRRWGSAPFEVPGAQVEKPENGREREQCDRGHQAPVLQYCEQSVDRCHRRPPTIMTIAPMSHSAKM